MSEICWMSAIELINSFKKKKLSPVEVTKYQLDRIEKINPKLNAFVTLVPDLALGSQHRNLKKDIRKGKRERWMGYLSL